MSKYILTTDTELYHYGVKGMKWGVRRTPEQLGHRPSKSKQSPSDSNDKEYGNPAMLIPLAPYALMLTTVAATRGYQWCRSKGYAKEREKAELEKQTGLKLKAKEMSWKEDVKRVNPDYYKGSDEVTHNCMMCTTAYDLRRRGYDVAAAKTEAGFSTKQIKKWYPNAKIKTVSGRDQYGRFSAERQTEKVVSELTKQGEGARGNIMVTWKGTGGGHSMAYEVRNGKVNIIDAQTNTVYNKPSKILNYCYDGISYARLDNVAFDKKQIKGCIADD